MSERAGRAARAARLLETLMFFVALAGATVAHAQAPDPRVLLARMGEAAGRYDYEGTFVYAHDGRIESIQVKRTLGADGAEEHLVALTGDRREVLRRAGELRLSLGPGVAARLPTDLAAVPSLDPNRFLAAAAHYGLVVAGEDRVAGFDATVLDARPLDDARYGYRLWLERDSGMLVGSKRYGPDGVAVEQLMFTELSLRPVTPQQAATAQPESSTPQLAGPAFVAPGMPAGFQLVAVPTDERGRRQFVYSDGLANVSIYVEALSDGMRALKGLERRGAMHLYARVVGSEQIVVVGDVPAATAQRIAAALKPGSSAATLPAQ